jgi:N-acetylornithine carbamoyltransferase
MTYANFKGKHFLNTQDWKREELEQLLRLAREMKQQPFRKSLVNKSMLLLFFNPSLRTRTSFQLGMQQLGGTTVVLNMGTEVWNLEVEEGAVMDGKAAEHIKEAARVFSRYGDIMGIRKFPDLQDWKKEKQDAVIQAFTKWGTVPIINMESHLYHPCQAMADVLTIQEHLGGFKERKFFLTWAYHPKPLPTSVPNSAILAASKMGMDIILAHPKGFDLDEDILKAVQENVTLNGSALRIVHSMEEGFQGADIVYAKSWGAPAFYGNWDEEQKLRAELKHWRVTQERMKLTRNGKFMHCLPVRRNIVVDDVVIDGPNSIVYDEAENRLHVQKAILEAILKNDE